MIYLTNFDRSSQITDGDFKIPTAIKGATFEFPFEGDNVSYIMSQEFMIYGENYLSTLPAIGSAHPSIPGIYFVGDSGLSDQGGYICTFTRTWASLPGFNITNQQNSTYTRKTYESFVYTQPGKFSSLNMNPENVLNGSSVWPWYIDQNAVTYPSDTTVKLYTQYKSDGTHWMHDLTSPTYNRVFIQYQVRNLITGLWTTNGFTTPIISIGDGDSITCLRVPFQYDNTTEVVYLFFSRPLFKQNPRQIVVPSTIEYTYFIPGLNCTSPDNIDLEQDDIFKIVDNQLNVTDILTEDSTPSLSTYAGYVTNKTPLLVESNLHLWKGNIYERQLRYVIAV